MYVQRKSCSAQRIAYSLLVREISSDERVYQKCGNKVCVNPEHLYLKSDDMWDLFWARVKQVDNCWLWTGAKNGRGVGKFRMNNQPVSVHVLVYNEFVESVPPYTKVYQTCRNPSCVKPEHLVLTLDKPKERFWEKVEKTNDCWIWTIGS